MYVRKKNELKREQKGKFQTPPLSQRKIHDDYDDETIFWQENYFEENNTFP